MTILIHKPSVIYIALQLKNKSENGSFSDSLPLNGWKLETEMVEIMFPFSDAALGYELYNKTFHTKHAKPIHLPKLTYDFVGIIFIKGN